MTDSTGRPVDHERLLREAMRRTDSASPQAPPPPTPAELAPHFPDFEILGLIGRGGMGAVYKAVQRKLGRVVALKVLPRHLATDPEFGERFHREARALAALNHPHVLTVHDFGAADGMHYLVTEFVDGVNLRQLMELGELSPAEALRITPQICLALQYAHDHGVVHRDVKPENILIDTRGQVKIADFGLAKLAGSDAERVALTRSTAVFGTPHYMAPEQWRGSGTVDHRADIYALGVVLYEMLTGELPLGHFDPPSARAGVPRGLDQVVQRALAQQPENRYQRARDVQTDVELQSSSKPRTPTTPRAAGGRLVKGPLVAIAIAVLGAVGMFAMVFVMEDGRRREAYQAHEHAAYDAAVQEIADWTAGGLEWADPLPDFPADRGPAPISRSVAQWTIVGTIPAALILIMLLGFASVRRIRNSGRVLHGMPLAVGTAWIVPIGLAIGLAFVPVAAIRGNDTQILVGIVFAVGLGAAAIWLLRRETRRQHALIAAGVPQTTGRGLMVLGYVLVFLIVAGTITTSLLAPQPIATEPSVTKPILPHHLHGRPVDFVIERLGPPTSISANRHGQTWAYSNEKGELLEWAVTLSGKYVLAADSTAVVLMPNPRPTQSPFLGQPFEDLVEEIGPPTSWTMSETHIEHAWPGSLRVSEKSGRVIDFTPD